MSRLKPSFFSDRYYFLTRLRKQMEQIIGERVRPRDGMLIIDLGCGDMPYRPLFERNGARYVGIDLVCNDVADLHASVEDSLPLAEGSVDVVLSTQVLEHVPEPTRYLSEIRRILKPDGLVIISTHGYWMYHPHPTDFWRWTGPGLRKLVADAGYRVLECRGIMGLASTGFHLMQDGLLAHFPRIVRRTIAPLTQGLVALADNLSSDRERENDASVFVLVAAK